MEEEQDLLLHQPEAYSSEELEIMQDNINTLDDNIGTLNGILETISESFQIA